MPAIRDVLLMHHSHTDIGYTHFQDNVFALNREYIRRAMDLAERYADGPPGEQFKWTCETTIMVEDFLRQARPDEVERLVALHRRGLIGFGGMYANLTPLYSTEMLARTLYTAGQLRRDYGLDIRYALNCDVNGQSWGLVEMLLEAGFEGLGMAINRVMARDPQPRPIAFWWQGPAGRQLLAWHGEHYGFGQNLGIPRTSPHQPDDLRAMYNLDLARGRLQGYMEKLQQQNYPYDFIYFQITSTFLWDNGGPHEELVRFVREWNSRGWEPRLQIIRFDELFDRLRQQPPETLETRQGEWTDWWMHGVSSTAFETALVRRNHGRLFAVQGLAAALQGLPQPLAYPLEADQRAWQSLALYDEHTWGGFDSITHPDSLNSRGQWHRKATYAYEGAAAVTRLAQQALQNLAARLDQPGQLQVLVYNPLPWPRQWPLLLPPVRLMGWENAQLEWDLELAGPQGQINANVDYGLIDLPACGYTAVPVRPVEPAAPAEPVFALQTPTFEPVLAPGLKASRGVAHNGWSLQNRFYKLEVDPASGAVRSLVDLASGYDWVDTSTSWRLGHYVYEDNLSPRGRSDMQLRYFVPYPPDYDRQPDLAPRRRGPERVLAQRFVPGAGHGRLSLVLQAPGVGDLRLQVVLYDDLPWIDFIYDFDKLAVTDPESVYLAFPFNLDQPVPRYEAAGAIVQAESQQLVNGTRDFYAVQNWVDFSNDRRGITVASPDAPIVHLGGFTNHKYLAQMQLEQPLLVGWPLNNHWFTNFRASQSGWMRFRYRLLPHESAFDPVAATRFGAEAAVEPLLGPVWDRPAGLEQRAFSLPVHLAEQASFLSVEPGHVHLAGLKPAADGQGIIVRLQELAGQAAEFRLRFPLSRVTGAAPNSLTEEPAGGTAPSVSEHEVTGFIEPYRLLTLRINLAA